MKGSGYYLALSCPKGDSIVLSDQRNLIGCFKVQELSIVTVESAPSYLKEGTLLFISVLHSEISIFF